MIVGNGLLAKRFASFKDDDKVVIFASGVSDSKATDEAAFEREHKLLSNTIEQNNNKRIVYFSTCSVLDQSVNQTPYVLHKINLERLIQAKAPLYNIFRLSNVVGNGGNKKTIINYLFEKINAQKAFSLWINSYRNIIDVDDTFQIITEILSAPATNEIINIAAPTSHSVVEIVTNIEKFLDKKAVFELVNSGSSYQIDTSRISKEIRITGIDFGPNYLTQILEKYYAHGLSNG